MAKHVTLTTSGNKNREEEEKRQSMIDRLIGNSRKTETKKTTETRTHSTAQATQTQPARQHSEIYMKQREHQPVVVARKGDTFYTVKPKYTVEQDVYEKSVKRQQGKQLWNGLHDYMMRMGDYNRARKQQLEETKKQAEEERKIQRGAAKAELMPGKTVDFMNAMEKEKEKSTGEKATTFAYPWQQVNENKPAVDVRQGTPYVNEQTALDNWQRQIDEENARIQAVNKEKLDKYYAVSGGELRAENIPGGTTDLFNQLENQKAKKTGEKGTTFGSGVRKPRAAGEQSFTEYINGLGEKAAQKKAEEPAEAPVQQQPVQRQEKPAEPVISKEDAGYKNADRGMKWGYPSNYSAKAPEATIAQTQADQEALDKADEEAAAAAQTPGTAPIVSVQPQSRAPQNAAPRRSNEDLQKDLDKHMLELYKQAEEKSKTYAGYDGFTDWAKTKGIYQEGTLLEWVTPAIYKEYMQEKMSRAGLYDQGTDVKSMSDEGLQNAEVYWNMTAQDLRDQADDLQKWFDDPVDRNGVDEFVYFAGDVLGLLNENDRGTDEYNKLVEDAAQRMMYSSIWGYQRTGEEGEQDKLRRSLYETIMNGEQYDDIVGYLEDEPAELEAFYGMLDTMIDNMLEHYKKAVQDVDKELQGMRDSADAYEYYADQAKEEIESRNWVDYYGKMAYNVNPELSKTSGEYDPTRVQDPQINLQGALDNSLIGKALMNPFQQGKDVFQFDPSVSEIDKKYWLANNALNMPIPASELDDVCFMTDEERKIFNQLYAYSYPKDGLQKAGVPEKFLEKIEPMLKQRKLEYADILARNVAQEDKLGIGGAARLATYIEKPYAGLEGTAETIKALFGEKNAAKLDTKGKILTRWINATRDQQNKDFSELVENWAGEFGGKAARLIADCTDSVVDNLVAMAFGKGVAGGTAKMITSPAARKVAQYAIQLIMSSEATASSFVEKLDGGMEGSEAAKYAIGDGIIEWITEKFSLETILNPDYMAQGTWKYLIRSAAAEGSEEIASDLLNMGLDSCLSYMDKHKTELVQKYYELLASGKYKGKEKEAWRQVLGDKMGEIMKSGLSGALSGLAMSGGHLVSTKQSLRTEGEKMLKTDKTAQGAGAIDSLLEAGKNIGEGSRSFSLAEKLEQLKKNNKKLSKLEVGKLSEQIQMEAREKADEAAKGTVYDTVHESLKAEGLQGNELQNVADAVTTALMEGENKLTKAQKKTLQSSKEGSHLLEVMRNDEEQQDTLYKKVQESVQPYTEAAEVAENLSRGKTKEGISVEDVNKQMADEDEQNTAEGTKTTGKGAAVIGGRWGEILGAKMKVVKDSRGRTKKVLVWEANVDGKTVDVDASDIGTMDFGTGALVRASVTEKSIYSADFLNTLFNETKRENVNIGVLMQEAKKIKMNAFLDMAMPETKLSEDMAKRIWTASLKEVADTRSAEVKNANYTGKAGVISFNGAEYGTEAYNRALDEANVDEATRKKMDVAAKIAKLANLSGLEFRTSADIGSDEIFGSESDAGIMLNIDGNDRGFFGNILRKHNMMVALGHEMTHWLQRNSLAGYNELRRYVLQTMAADGVNLYEMVDNKIANYRMQGKELDLNGAISEIVANACDQILNNETVQQRLAESNPTLFNKVKDFVSDFVGRIREAVDKMDLSASSEGRYMLKYSNELAKRWLGAYDETISRKIAEAEGKSAEAEKENFSIAELPDGTKYVNVDIDQKQFAKMNQGQRLKAAKRVIIQKFIEAKNNIFKLPDNTGNVIIDSNFANEYAFPSKRIRENNIKSVKGKVSTEIDNLIKTAKRVYPGDPLYPNPSYGHTQKNMKYYSVLFKVGTKFYTGILNVQVRKHGQHLLDLTQIKEDTSKTGLAINPITQKSDAFASAQDTVTQNNSKSNLSIAEKNNEYSLTERNADGYEEVRNDDGEPIVTILSDDVVAKNYSLGSWIEKKEREKVIKALQQKGYTEAEIKKWIDDVDSIAAIIASDRTMYDFVADRNKKFLKPNGDVYKKTVDASTMCKKTRLYNGVFNLVQHMLPNTILKPEDLIDLYNMMKDEKLETPCKFCYVQSRRRHLGNYAEDWLKKYQGDYIPRVDELTTSDGLEKLRAEHPKTYSAFVRAMNRKGVNNPKLVQHRTDYRGEIRRLKADTVRYLKEIGGLRIQSFSDFETVHLLDMMQVVMDLKAMNLTAQAYTKIPDFAWVFGRTGIKINLSLVGKLSGLDANGNLIFDNEEGIDFDEAMALRKMYGKNVGTVIVGINDDHIIACMGDSRIDFIIPFHKSGWSENELKHMRGLEYYKDYTDSQNEYNISYDENGNRVLTKAESNIDPLSYWVWEENGEQNARRYLDKCNKEGIVPKFAQYLEYKDGKYMLPEGTDKRSTNIRTGYWKTLIDFKMYDNEGNGARQTEVQPDFNMEQARRVMEEYAGDHRVLPENVEVAKKYVRYYKKTHPLNEERTRYSMAEPVERLKDGMVAVHNLTEQNLLDTIAEGGFTAPSIAVIRAAMGHSKYGEISVIFNKDTIDPRKSTKNKVYGADAWTPTRGNAQIETQLIYEAMNDAMDHVKKNMEGVEDYYYNEAQRWLNERAYHEETTKSIDDWSMEAYGNEGMLAAYLSEKGEKIEEKYREDPVRTDLDKRYEDDYRRWLDVLDRDGLLDEFMEDMKTKSIEWNMKKWGPEFAKAGEQEQKIYENYSEKPESISKRILAARLRKMYLYQQDGREIKTTKRVDHFLTLQAMQENVDRAEFNKWMYKLVKPAFGKSGVYNGVDPYDSMGNRRSWSRTHWDATTENIVKAMYRNHEAKGGEAGGATGLMAKASKEYKSIDEIRADKGRLQTLEDEEYQEKVQDLEEDLKETAGGWNEYFGISTSSIKAMLIEAAGEYARTESAAAVRKSLQGNGLDVNDKMVEGVIRLFKKAQEIPTGYFEAKPERVVGFDEIAKVILPANADQELFNALEEQGINYEVYDGTDADRLAKLNDDDSVMFSMNERNSDVTMWMNSLTPGMLRNDAERQLLQEYKGLRIKIDVASRRIEDYQKTIWALQQKPQLTEEERKTLTEAQSKLEEWDRKHQNLENQLDEVVSSEGYAGMMYYWNNRLNETAFGKTQAEVDQAVTELQREAKEIAKRIEKRHAEIKELSENSGIQTIRRELGRKGLSKAVKLIKGDLNTAMSTDELHGRMAEIVLTMLQNKDAMPLMEALSNDIVNYQMNSNADIAREALEPLRGMTIRVSKAQLKEAKARGWGLREIRSVTKGSGIKYVESKDNNNSLGGSDLEELYNLQPDLRGKLDNETSALVDFVDYVANRLNETRGGRGDFGIDFDYVMANIMSYSGLLLTEDFGGLSREELQEKVERETKRLQNELENVDKLKGEIDALLESGNKAARWSDMLSNDLYSAVDYYDKIAKQAAEIERQRVKQDVIKALKSENTRKLIAQQQKYLDMINRDKKARVTAEDNLKLRKKIHTNVKRLKKLLISETDTNNIPEEAKPLARYMTAMLAKNDAEGYRHILFADQDQLVDYLKRLEKMDQVYGKFEPDKDLDWLVVHAPNPADDDYDAKYRVEEYLAAIEQGLDRYRKAEGRGVDSLTDRKAALEQMQDAVSKIMNVIMAKQKVEINRRKYEVKLLAAEMEQEMHKSRFKGEYTSGLGKALDKAWRAVGYGNLTPQYFFKNLKNSVMDLLYSDFKDAENRGGLEADQAQKDVGKIAKETGYATWDGQEKHQVNFMSGPSLNMTTEQLMALYATWLREKNTLRPEETSHLLNGGFVLPTNNEKGKGVLGVLKMNQRPYRLTPDDLDSVGSYLTKQQLTYVRRMVEYLSKDMAELGNEASMRMFGIKKYTEQWYFPIKSWQGVLNSRSDAGISSSNENRSGHQSFTNRVKANAHNAIEIADFTPTAIKHIVGMINYSTVAPAVENMNRVLNQQLTFGDEEEHETDILEAEDNTYKMNMRAVFQNTYGKRATDYMKQFMKDINGGVARRNDVIAREKLLSIFRKSAVAGSLSVAMQQPLSYIRAAMELNPKYLAASLNPTYYKGSFNEMMKYSGIAVIKQMGKHDMNYGRSMQEYIMPEAMKTKAQATREAAVDKINALPALMDNMTWTRIWSACKIEQAQKHKGMDLKSDEFLQLVAERFNDVIRNTQVYDSVMVKSQNMRSDNYAIKSITSFMAEPTLSLNVLADAWENMQEKGGKEKAAKALATYILSAVMQALVKGVMSAGRTPDEKKTEGENFLYYFGKYLLTEMNPLNLIPGYSNLIDVLMNGKLTDDSYTVIGKAFTSYERMKNMVMGKEGKGWYRDIEDGIGQLVQYATDVPMKNIMRDVRAMINLMSGGTAAGLTGGGYSSRATSGDVLKYQLIDTVMQEDLIGLINTKLGEAGYKTDNKGYFDRLYSMQKSGEKGAEGVYNYLKLAKLKGANPDKTIRQELNKRAKADTELTGEERIGQLAENNYGSMTSYIKDQYLKGEIELDAAERLYREQNQEKSEKDIAKTVGTWDWEKNNKKLANGQKEYTNYTPLLLAIEDNDLAQIRSAVREMERIGYKKADMKKEVNKNVKALYATADSQERIRLRDALQKTYKELGLTAEDADKTIKNWKLEEKSSRQFDVNDLIASGGYSDSGSKKRKKHYTEKNIGQYGAGNIDLYDRPMVKMKDGSYATVRSFSVNIDGKEILLPTVINGKVVSEEKAIEHYYKTGEYLGIFDTVKEANEYAEALHRQQEKYYKLN